MRPTIFPSEDTSVIAEWEKAFSRPKIALNFLCTLTPRYATMGIEWLMNYAA
jgi:hypothetical protein